MSHASTVFPRPSTLNSLITLTLSLSITLSGVEIFAANPTPSTTSPSTSFSPIVPTEFAKIVNPSASLETIATGFQFLEGPVWIPADNGYLIFSDIPANKLHRWTREAGVTLFRYPSRNANGNTTDLKGRLVSAEHSGRRVSYTTKKDNIKAVVTKFSGKQFNSPNDVVVKSDGTYWFTDPDYGLPKGETKEMEGNFVYRYNEDDESTKVVAADFDKPNGLCFSPDEKLLYIADSGKPHHIRVFQVQEDGSLTKGRVFATIDPGGPDGIRCDAEGRVWSSAGNGVQVFNPDGTLIGKINTPQTAANLCFGGPDGKTLFITAQGSLYAVPTLTQGAPRPASTHTKPKKDKKE